MDPVRLGNDVRLLRRRRGWSQRRLAREAAQSRWAVAMLEAGRSGRLRLEMIVAIVAALGAHLNLRIVYQGEALDRLRDRRHAELVEAMVRFLRELGWEVATEVSFNDYGERGSIDILAFHPVTRTLLVIEVKSLVPDLGGMLATIDRKVRLARKLAAGRGWEAGVVGRLLVLPETSTSRRRVAQHEATFANAFQARNVAVNAGFAGRRVDCPGSCSCHRLVSSAIDEFRPGRRTPPEHVHARASSESSSSARWREPMTEKRPPSAAHTSR